MMTRLLTVPCLDECIEIMKDSEVATLLILLIRSAAVRVDADLMNQAIDEALCGYGWRSIFFVPFMSDIAVMLDVTMQFAAIREGEIQIHVAVSVLMMAC